MTAITIIKNTSSYHSCYFSQVPFRVGKRVGGHWNDQDGRGARATPPSSNPTFVSCSLCDLDHVIQTFRASVFSYVNGNYNRMNPIRLEEERFDTYKVLKRRNGSQSSTSPLCVCSAPLRGPSRHCLRMSSFPLILSGLEGWNEALYSTNFILRTFNGMSGTQQLFKTMQNSTKLFSQSQKYLWFKRERAAICPMKRPSRWVVYLKWEGNPS